jgi:lysozyme family protein
MSNFDKAILPLLEHEGGYVNDSSDAGGETKYGISKRSYPNEDIKNLTVERATFLYQRDFWRMYMDELPYIIAAKLFDCSVNMGHKWANTLLQRAAGVIDDGVIGHNTVYAICKDDPILLLNRYIVKLKKYYDDIIESKPQNAKFKAGWYKRAEWIPKVG